MGPIAGHLGELPTTDSSSTGWSWAAGGLVSDADDLAGWLELLLHGDVLEEADRQAMLAPSRLPDRREFSYGLGLQLRTGTAGDQAGHKGSTMGFQAERFGTQKAPDGPIAAVPVNDSEAEASDAASELWDVLRTVLVE